MPSSEVSLELYEALKALAERYDFHRYNDRYIVVENPEFAPDKMEDPNLVIDVALLKPRHSGRVPEFKFEPRDAFVSPDDDDDGLDGIDV